LKNITAGALGESGASDGASRVRLRGDGSGAVVEWQGAITATDSDGEDPFRSLAGAAGLRMALAAKIVRAHGGEVSSEGGRIRARLPLR
jgi:signal transduction histidine kinase